MKPRIKTPEAYPKNAGLKILKAKIWVDFNLQK
jgi:hypothetical protein